MGCSSRTNQLPVRILMSSSPPICWRHGHVAATSTPRGIRQIGQGLGTLDREVFEAIAESPSPLLDAVMPRLTRAADHSKLWLVIAAALVAYQAAERAARRHPRRAQPGGDQPVHQPGGQADLEAAAAEPPLGAAGPAQPAYRRRRTRCRRAIRPVRRRSRSASGWKARRWGWAWRCWRAWLGCPGWRPARTTPVTCSPVSASAPAIAVLGARVVPPIVDAQLPDRRPAAAWTPPPVPTAPAWCWWSIRRPAAAPVRA